MLREPEKRGRELQDGEGRIMDAVRDDYAPLIEFARITGLRASEVRTLEWAHVNWSTRQIVRLGKGGSGINPDHRRGAGAALALAGPSRAVCFHPHLQADETAGPDQGAALSRHKEGLKTAWRRVLNHSNLSTTAKYAHVIDEEVAAALQAQARGRVRRADRQGGESPE